MSHLHRNLFERIRGEVSDLELVIARATRAWSLVLKSPDEYAYIDSVALNLHSFYSGVESLFELIARHVDRSLPNGEAWHRGLVEQMQADRPDIRPAVISRDTATAIDEFRRFRHLVRNVYTINLRPDRINGLMTSLPQLWSQLRAELLAFADYLEVLDSTAPDTG